MELSLKDSLLSGSTAKEKEEPFAAEPCSSKDTTTLDRSNSPRNSKSGGTVSQRDLGSAEHLIARDAEDVSLSSLSDHGKQSARACVDISVRGGTVESELSNHSRLRTPVDDLHEADSLHSLRGKDQPGTAAAAAAFSASDDAREGDEERDAEREEIQSRSISSETALAASEIRAPEVQPANSLAALVKQRQSVTSKGLKRPRSLTLEDDLSSDRGCCRAKEDAVKEQSVPKSPVSAFASGLSLRKGSEHTKSATAHVGKGSSDRDGESLSRAPSAIPAHDESVGDEPPATPKKAMRKQPRSKPSRKVSSALSNRRSSRVAALDTPADCTEVDEDYLPPGESGEASPAAPSVKRMRSTRARAAAALPKPCIPSSTPPGPSLSARPSSRLRGAGFSPGPPALLASPSLQRRLRSQPLDVSSLMPDAYALEPPAKRSKHCALQAGLQCLRTLESEASAVTTLARSATSGVQKPRPAWLPPPSTLEECQELSVKSMRARQAADFKLLDGQDGSPAKAADESTGRLGLAPLAKVLAASSQSESREQGGDDQEGGVSFLKACQRLMPSSMRSVCEAWDERLNAPCIGVMGEPTTCIKARMDRNLQNIWDDLLSRHALETGVQEGFSQWLASTLQQEQ